MIAGIYAMINGLGSIADFYTRAIAMIAIGLGVIFCVASVYEHLDDSDDDSGSVIAESDDD